MIRIALKLLSLPFIWSGQLLSMVGLPLGAELLKLAWAVSGDGATGQMALMQVQRHSGVAAAAALAAAWMARRGRPEIAAWAGVMAAQHGDMALARDYLGRGRALGDDPSGLFELLDFWLAGREGGPARHEKLLAELEARRDLNPYVRKQVLEGRLWQVMLAGKHAEAGARARHLLSIDACPVASVALWGLDRKAGRTRQAERRLAESMAMPEGDRLYYQCLANLATGEIDKAEAGITAMQADFPQLAQAARQAWAQKRGAS